MATDIINFCENKGMMYGCAKKEDPAEQKKCSYHEESKYHPCMYLKFDEFCDCLDAIQKKKESEAKKT